MGEFIIGEGGNVENRSFDNDYYQLLGNIPISQKPTNEFTIIRTQEEKLYLGIIDAQYIYDRNSFEEKRR